MMSDSLSIYQSNVNHSSEPNVKYHNDDVKQRNNGKR